MTSGGQEGKTKVKMLLFLATIRMRLSNDLSRGQVVGQVLGANASVVGR